VSHKHARDRAEKHKSCSFARLPHELWRQHIVLSVICPLPSVRVRSRGFPQMGGCYLLKYNGGDSGIKISVLYWRCSLIRVSVIRGYSVFLFLLDDAFTSTELKRTTKWPWPNLECCVRICLQELSKNTKFLFRSASAEIWTQVNSDKKYKFCSLARDVRIHLFIYVCYLLLITWWEFNTNWIKPCQ
jgi:hypothetical protein